MFNALYFVDSVVVHLVLCSLGFVVLFMFFSPGFDSDFISTSQEISWQQHQVGRETLNKSVAMNHEDFCHLN